MKGATGSATLLYYRLETGESATYTQFTELIGNLVKRGSITSDNRVRLELNVGGDDTDDIVFDAYITSASISVSTGELSVVPINFTMDGEFRQVIS